jgi:hypothetical protein
VELVRHTYGSDYGLQPALGVGNPSHFFKCKSIVDKVTVCRLRRQKSLSQLPNLVRLVEEDLTRGTDGASSAS